MGCRNICLKLYAKTKASGSHYMAGGNTAEGVNAILSLQKCSVNVVETGLELVRPQEYTKKKLEP
jgi:uncharacterized protein YqfA (UPF0365 family)